MSAKPRDGTWLVICLLGGMALAGIIKLSSDGVECQQAEGKQLRECIRHLVSCSRSVTPVFCPTASPEFVSSMRAHPADVNWAMHASGYDSPDLPTNP